MHELDQISNIPFPVQFLRFVIPRRTAVLTFCRISLPCFLPNPIVLTGTTAKAASLSNCISDELALYRTIMILSRVFSDCEAWNDCRNADTMLKPSKLCNDSSIVSKSITR